MARRKVSFCRGRPAIGLVDGAQVGHGERLAEQPPRVGCRRVLGAQPVDGQGEDRGVVVGQPQPCSGRGEAGEPGVAQRVQLGVGEHVEVGHGQHPAAVVAVGVVEHVQLLGVASGHPGLDRQGPPDGVGEGLARVQERAGQRPARSASGRGWVPADQQDRQGRRLVGRRGGDGEDRGVDRDGRARVVGQGAPAGVTVGLVGFHAAIVSDPRSTVRVVSAEVLKRGMVGMRTTMTSMVMPQLHVGRGAQVGPLTVFPVWASAPAPVGLVTGRAARVRVAEREGSPVVGELVVTNVGDRTALLVEGELLEGGWQHRVLQHDLVLAAAASMVAPVACVEAGRWHGGGGHARRARRASGSVRAALQVVAPVARQQEVWRRVAGYDAAMGPSATSSFVDHLDRLATPASGSDSAESRRPGPGRSWTSPSWCGSCGRCARSPGSAASSWASAGSRCCWSCTRRRGRWPRTWVSCSPGCCWTRWPPTHPIEATPGRRARRMVERLDGREATQDHHVDAGAGELFALDTEHAVVRGVTVDHAWAHLSAFNRQHPLLEVA